MSDAVVLALSRSTRPRAEALARALDGVSDLLIVGKLHLPWRDDIAMGAIGETGDAYLDQRFIELLGIDEAQLAEIARDEYEHVCTRAAALRGDHPAVDLHDHTAIIVANHEAAGTLQVSAREARRRGATRVVLAPGEISAELLDRVAADFDEILAA